MLNAKKTTPRLITYTAVNKSLYIYGYTKYYYFAGDCHTKFGVSQLQSMQSSASALSINIKDRTCFRIIYFLVFDT